jgi:hypothetical protein
MTDDNDEQPLKQLLPRYVTEFGITINNNEEHS